MRTGLTKQEKITDIWFDEKDPSSISAPTTPPSKGGLPLMPSSTPTSAARPTQTPKRAAWSLILQRGVSLSV